MNPRRFFVNKKPRNTKPKILKKDLFFTFDDTPGYFKDGYFYDIKSMFTGWKEEGEIHDDPIDRDKHPKRILKDNSLFGEEITLRQKLIKKIFFVPNYRLEDTKRFFENQKKIENDPKMIIDENPYLTELSTSEERKDNFYDNELDDNDYEYLASKNSDQQIERIYNEIKMNEEELKEYKLKLEEAEKSKKDIFQIIKDIRNNNYNDLNISDSEDTNPKLIKDIENNEMQFLSQNKQNEFSMMFIPDEIKPSKDLNCLSCGGNGHSKEMCIEFPDPEYDKQFKHCINCGGFGHLYCRNGINDNVNNKNNKLEEDDENCVYNNGKRYYFDFNLKEDCDKGASLIQEDEEELYETGTGTSNNINEESKDDNITNHLI